MGRSNTRIIILIGSAVFILVLLSTRQYSSSSFGIKYIREGYYVFEKVVTTPFSFVADIWDNYIGLVNTSRENKELRKQIDRLKVQNMRTEELKSENRLLRGMLQFSNANRDLKLIPARVLSQDISLIYKTAIIDKGVKSGFRMDMPVLTPDGIVGKVVAVSPHTAQILLITDPNSAIPTAIESTRVKGILKGRGGNHLILDYVRREEEVKKGDSIVTSGLLGVFPKGLKVGYVERVIRDPNKIFADIEVRPSVEMDKIEGIFGIDGDMEASH